MCRYHGEKVNCEVTEEGKKHSQRWKTMENSSKDFFCETVYFFSSPPQSMSFVFDAGVIVARVVFSAASAAVVGRSRYTEYTRLMCHLYARILHNSKHVLFCIKRYLMLSFLCRSVSFSLIVDDTRLLSTLFFSLLLLHVCNVCAKSLCAREC